MTHAQDSAPSYRHIRDLIDGGHGEEALRILRSYDELNAEGHYLLGYCLCFCTAQWDEAIACLTRSLEKGFFPFWGHFIRAHAYRRLGNLGQAITELVVALSYEKVHRPAVDLLRDWCREDLRIVLPATRVDLLQAFDSLTSGSLDDVAPMAVAMPLNTQAIEDARRDVLLSQTLAAGGRLFPQPFGLETKFPIAIASNDHIEPRGTKLDNTRHPPFVAACERLFERPLSALDLGCAGGGLVLDFLLRGHRAIGLEGSDFSLRQQRAEWRVIPLHLATCDIVRPFKVIDGDDHALFDIITAWEVLEHLHEYEVPALLENIRRHLAPDGLFAASIAQFPDFSPATGITYHNTIRPVEWWHERCRESGLEIRDGLFKVDEYVRGSGNGSSDWDIRLNPDCGFHLVASLPTSSPKNQCRRNRFPFVRLANGRPAFKSDAGPLESPPAAIISVPKAGTYLFGKLLTVLGLVDTEIHAGEHGFDDYRDRSLDERRSDYLNFNVSSPFSETARLVASGQFLVGHLPRTELIVTALDSFRRFFVVRDLREAMVSHMRFMTSTGRGGALADEWRSMPDGADKMLAYMHTLGPNYLRLCEEVSGWVADIDCIRVPFEVLVGDAGVAFADDLVYKVQEALECRSIISWADLAPRFINVPTLTYSGERTRLARYWDERVARCFTDLGGDKINTQLGY